MANQYSDCYFCGGEVIEQPIRREIWWKGQLHVIENVPAGVCRQCGQKVVLPAVAKVIDRLLAGATPPDAVLQVPAYQFRDVGQVA